MRFLLVSSCRWEHTFRYLVISKNIIILSPCLSQTVFLPGKTVCVQFWSILWRPLRKKSIGRCSWKWCWWVHWWSLPSSLLLDQYHRSMLDVSVRLAVASFLLRYNLDLDLCGACHKPRWEEQTREGLARDGFNSFLLKQCFFRLPCKKKRI